MRLFWVIGLLLLGAAGCSEIDLLDRAEAIMNDAPEDAYYLLDSIDSKSVRSRALSARYALIKSEVMYKNYIPAPNDSLIMIAVRYYSGGNHPDQLFRSFYSLGCIYYELGRMSDAAVALGQAEQIADKIDDDFRLGLLYSQIGDVFFNTYDFHRAERYYRLAMSYFSAAGKDVHLMYALYEVGRCLMQQNDYSATHSTMDEIFKWAEENNDSMLMASCLLNKLSCSVYENNLKSAQEEADRYVSLFGPADDKNVSVMNKFARYYIMTGEYERAQDMINNAWNKAGAGDSIDILYVESLLQERIGNLFSAIDSYKRSIEIQNDNLRSLLDQPVLGAQKDYYRSLSEIESLRASRNKNVIILLVTILILLVIIVRIVYYNQKIKSESEKQGYLLTIKELRLNEDSNNETINRLNNRVNKLFSKQYSELDEIFDRIIELDNIFPDDSVNSNNNGHDLNQIYYKKWSLFYKKIQAKFEDIKSSKNQKELDRIINDTFDNIMSRLLERKLKLSENDLIILRLLIIGFSPKVVSYIMCEQQKTIYQKRARILKRLEQNAPELSTLLYKILRIK